MSCSVEPTATPVSSLVDPASLIRSSSRPVGPSQGDIKMSDGSGSFSSFFFFFYFFFVFVFAIDWLDFKKMRLEINRGE